jgi:6-pyruvoyltetrahydropterin/6-carboxytetrahydropterin synthase
MFEIVVEDEFSAAHALRLYDGSWEPRHGHLFKVAVAMRSEGLDQIGVVVDFEKLKPALKTVLAEFEGRSFNDHPDFKEGKKAVSTEAIAKTVYDRLHRQVNSPTAKITKVTVWETPDAQASYLP